MCKIEKLRSRLVWRRSERNRVGPPASDKLNVTSCEVVDIRPPFLLILVHKYIYIYIYLSICPGGRWQRDIFLPCNDDDEWSTSAVLFIVLFFVRFCVCVCVCYNLSSVHIVAVQIVLI